MQLPTPVLRGPRCSGDDALNVAGLAAPVLQGCTLQGRKSGLRAMGHASALLLDTKVEKCGLAGLQVMDSSNVTCTRHAPPPLAA